MQGKKTMGLYDIPAVDIMNYLFTAESAKRDWDNSFRFESRGRTTLEGRRYSPRKGWTPAEYVAMMDDAGYEKVMIPAVKMYSYQRKKYVWNISADEVHEAIKDFPDRLVGLAGYDPFHIMDSVREIERAVKDYGFKGVYAHSYGFNVPYDDRSFYPLYETCARLGIPVAMQVGHALEVMPNDCGRPITLDRPALDFPEVTFVGSHTGWPWCEEMIAECWKHDNIYVDVSAHRPRYLEPSFLHNIDSRINFKTLYGTNGPNLKERKLEFLELGLKEESLRYIFRDNAYRLYKLQPPKKPIQWPKEQK